MAQHGVLPTQGPDRPLPLGGPVESVSVAARYATLTFSDAMAGLGSAVVEAGALWSSQSGRLKTYNAFPLLGWVISGDTSRSVASR